MSAKDKSTGKAQSVTIRSSGGLSDSDIERMVNEAEASREDDQKRREMIDVKNEADQAVYNTEKQLQEQNKLEQLKHKNWLNEQMVKKLRTERDSAL